MKKALLLVVLLAQPLSARVTDVYGLSPAWWQQRGQRLIPLTVYDCTTSPEWPAVVQEVVAEWNTPPFDLTYARPTDCSVVDIYRTGDIAVRDAANIAYGGVTYQFVDNRLRMIGATIAVDFAWAYQATDFHDRHWYLRRVMGHEMGNALTMGESGPHDSLTGDPGCLMGYQDGVNINTPFDHSILCQRYVCR